MVDFVYYQQTIIAAPAFPKDSGKESRIVSGKRYRSETADWTHNRWTMSTRSNFIPNRNPKHSTLPSPDGETVIKGIYEVSADTLRRAYSQPGDPRPTQFEAGNQTYQIWKRIVDRPTEVKN